MSSIVHSKDIGVDAKKKQTDSAKSSDKINASQSEVSNKLVSTVLQETSHQHQNWKI